MYVARLPLTIGMACANDYQGVYFTTLALRMYHSLEPDDEIIVIDNTPDSEDGKLTKNFIEQNIPNGRYISYTAKKSTAVREQIFIEASNPYVVCLDCHVLLWPNAVARLKKYFEEHKDSQDLLQGPMLHDNFQNPCTHLDPVWRHAMYGVWGNDRRGFDENSEPFEIPMQGLGVFASTKKAWPGFSPYFQGFGCEEWYIGEKFRWNGGKVLCLPFLRWTHRFNRPGGHSTGSTAEDKVWNYAVAFREFGADPTPMIDHFGEFHPPREKWQALTDHCYRHLAAVEESIRSRERFYSTVYST